MQSDEVKHQTTYPQDWHAYDTSQCTELTSFLELLSDLCKNVEQPQYEFGRPALTLADMVFASGLKVYSTFSLRRFMSYMEKAVAEGYADRLCSYSSVSNYMRKKELTPVLRELVHLSSLPLAAVESIFAMDSTGFSTSRFARYYNYKHGNDMVHKTWLKVHVVCGVQTNIVTAVLVTEQNASDIRQFNSLMEKTATGFMTSEILADRAYLSRNNMDLAERFGATPFIPFKKNTTGKAGGSHAWKRMWHFFQLHKEDFLKHYHKRSNVETVFHMIKSKFRDHIRSRDRVAQMNEVLLKVLCHNICVVIQETHELGIHADFINTKSGI